MLTDQRILGLWTEGNGYAMTTNQALNFARAIERATAEEAMRLVGAEEVDYEATRAPEDRAYNLALDHAASSIRQHFKLEEK